MRGGVESAVYALRAPLQSGSIINKPVSIDTKHDAILKQHKADIKHLLQEANEMSANFLLFYDKTITPVIDTSVNEDAIEWEVHFFINEINYIRGQIDIGLYRFNNGLPMHNVIEKLEASRDELKIFIRKLEILATKENLDDYIDLLLHNKKKSKGFVAFVDKLKLDTELKESFVRATINYFKYLQKESGRFDKIIASLRMLSQAQTEMGTMVESAKAIGIFP